MWIGEALKVLAETLGIISKQQDLKNAPDVQKAAKAEDERRAIDKTNRALATGDVEEMRRQDAE